MSGFVLVLCVMFLIDQGSCRVQPSSQIPLYLLFITVFLEAWRHFAIRADEFPLPVCPEILLRSSELAVRR